MKKRALFLAAVLTASLGLVACQKSAAIEDANGLRSAVLKRAPELGSDQVAALSISGSAKNQTAGRLTVVKPDGSAVTKPLEGDGSGMTETISPGQPADKLPYTELFKLYTDAKQQCGDMGASAEIKTTMTGKSFIDARCLDVNKTNIKQLLDGKESIITTLDRAEDIDKVLQETSVLLGTKITSITFVFNSVIQSIGPHVAAVGTPVKAAGKSCEPSVRREVSGISFDVGCSTADGPQGQLDIAGLTGKMIADALAKAYQELGISGSTETARAVIITEGDRRLLQVTPVKTQTPAQVPLN